MTDQATIDQLDQMLREHGGIDPGKVGPVVNLAALGIVNGAWRNTVVEDWHVEHPALSDGNMMRNNSHMTWRVQQMIHRWLKEVQITANDPVKALDIEVCDYPYDPIEDLAYRIYRWLTNPSRKLIIGMTLGGLAGDGLEKYRECADRALGSVAATAEKLGGRYCFARAAVHGALACRHWWGHARWPVIVDRTQIVLDDPEHPHWRGDRDRRGPEPPELANRKLLRRTLLYRPWELSQDAADWLVYAGIGFLDSPYWDS